MEALLDFSAVEAVLLSESGGKGASLARLAQADFPVPGGFIVTSGAYLEFIESDTGFQRAVGELEFENADRLREQCEVIRQRLGERPLPEPVRECLAQRASRLLEDGPVSVRSSSTMEDLAGAAFAGQHDTFLNVTSVDGVLQCNAQMIPFFFVGFSGA